MKKLLSTLTIALAVVLIVYFGGSVLTSTQPATVGMYWPMLGILPLLVFGLWAHFLPDPKEDRFTEWRSPIGGWYELDPKIDAHRQRFIYFLCLSWNLVTGFVVIHYWRKGEAPSEGLLKLLFNGACVLYILAGIAAAGAAINYWIVSQKEPVKHMHVETSKFPLQLGRSTKLRIETEFSAGTRPMIVRIGIMCVRASAQYVMGTPIYVARKIYAEQWSDVVMNQTIATGERLVLDREFKIPQDAPPSSPKDKLQSPWFMWEIVVIVTFANAWGFRRRYIVPAEHEKSASSTPRAKANQGTSTSR